MMYLAQDGRTAKIISVGDNADTVRVVIGDDEPIMMSYSDFIGEFSAIAKDRNNSLDGNA